MRKAIAIAIMTSLMLSSMGVMADYFQYVEEHRKPGQTVEEARKEQMEHYREAMKKKHDRIERQYASGQDRKPKGKGGSDLELTDEQKVFMKKIHQERREFMKKKREEVRKFNEQKEKEVLETLNYEQRANLQKMKKGFHKKHLKKEGDHEKKKNTPKRPNRQGL